jgi:hypothetical protein
MSRGSPRGLLFFAHLNKFTVTVTVTVTHTTGLSAAVEPLSYLVACIHTYTHTHIHTYTHIHKYNRPLCCSGAPILPSCLHTHIHTYTHTHTYTNTTGLSAAVEPLSYLVASTTAATIFEYMAKPGYVKPPK